MVSKSDILGLIEIDDDAKKVFLAMPREEQLLAILGMVSHIRSEEATNKKKIITLADDFKTFKTRQDEFRIARDAEDQRVGQLIQSLIIGRGNDATRPLSAEDAQTTTQKIVREITKQFAARFDFWVYMRDKVLPSIISFIVLAILALIFAKSQMP